jgi:DNA-binding response OmpR family regulator
MSWEAVVEKSRILIVEDDLDLSEMLNAYFRVQNYDVLTAAWGADALRISQEELVDLIVLDIRLPDIDGYEICRQLRSHRQTLDTPIIFLTEKRDRVDKLQGLELGVVDYITKPFDIQELRLRVRNAISRATRHALMNPVTDLPEGDMVEERLNTLLYSDEEWAVLTLSIASLSEFREMYGFVAADDVLRAVALMIRNAVREFGSEDNFIGHLSSDEFAIITSPEAVKNIRERLETRVQQSREYFYPARDRQKVREGNEANHLSLNSASVDSKAGRFDSLDDLRKALSGSTTTP